ncbi:MAG: DUF3488 domain-containing protein [Myxococcales bacterium]|nr:DUF3488 domain-containing protein [Myxococcales bacterium]
MRFAQVHKVAVYILSALGLLALGAGGELPGLSVALIVAGFAASWFVEGERLVAAAYTRGWSAALALSLLVEIARVVFFDTDPLMAIVELTAILQVNRLANRRDARVYQQITLLAGLMLVAATVLGGGLSYALAFLGFVLIAPWAMTLGHLRREIEGNYLADARAGRAGVPIDVARILRSRRVVGAGLLAGSSLLSVPIFLLTAVIFVLFPRIGLGLLTVRQRPESAVAGFGNSVDLTGHGTIRDNPTIVLRAQPGDLGPNPPSYRALRLRGATFDTYTGRGWTRRVTHADLRLEREATRYTLLRPPDPSRDVAWRVVLDPIDPPVLFAPAETVGFSVDARYEAGLPRYTELLRDRDDGVRYTRTSDEAGLVYTAWVATGRTPPSPRALDEAHSPRFRQRYLQLPADLSPELGALAQRLTNPAQSPLARALAVQQALHRFRYTTEMPSGRAARPLDDFLFRTRAGHCEYFSTAMVVLLRSVGVPSRNVTGFLGGTYNRYGRFYAVHQGDAHSWVEVWDDREGWVTFDPTPPSTESPAARTGFLAEADAVLEAARLRWRAYIVDFDLSTQANLARAAWRFAQRHRRGGGAATEPAAPTGRSWRPSRPAVSLKPAVAVLLALASLGVAVWFLRGLWRGSRADRAGGLGAAQRAAVSLARALDEAVSRAGHPRPLSRAPLKHAELLVAKGVPGAEVALRVAERYVALRFGEARVEGAELGRLHAALKALGREADAGR